MTARILILDHGSTLSEPLGRVLSAEYYQVTVVPVAGAAAVHARLSQPDLIAIDLDPARADGLAICADLKADAATRDIPVVVITATARRAEGLRALESGADDYLAFPEETDIVLARVRSLAPLNRLANELGLRRETARVLGLTGDRKADAPGAAAVAGTRALVVERDDGRAAAIQEALFRDGIVAARARGEAEALALTPAVQFDLIVLSLSREGDDHLRLASRLRATDANHVTPILLWLAEPGARDRLLRGLELGVSDWLRHPFDGDELRARARNQIRRKLRQDRLRADFEQALGLALIDPLTGLYNQRYLTRHLAGLIEAGQPGGIAVLMVDVDHFKAVNDQWGHAIGNQALKAVAERLTNSVRLIDCVSRYGGEEFVVLMPGTRPADALGAAERLRSAVETMHFSPASDLVHRMTVSIGAAFGAGSDLSATDLLHAADLALYRAKQLGRNRVETAPPATDPAGAT